jgi:hypothetical protein
VNNYVSIYRFLLINFSKILKIYFQVGETSGKPSVMIVRNNPLDCEVNKATKELSELQKVCTIGCL